MKNKKLAFLLLAILLVFCVLFAVACQPIDEPVEEDDPIESVVSDGLLISNGTFANIGTSNSSVKYLKSSVPGWTAINGAKDISTQGIVMGIIDLDEEKFESNKANLIGEFSDYPGIASTTEKNSDGTYIDTNALVLGIPSTLGKGSVYFRSEDITIEKNGFYELNLNIYTDLVNQDNQVLSGASICFTDGLFSEFLSIDTNKEWRTYKYLIKGNDYEDRKFKVQLWLGHGPSKIGEADNPYLASGVVLFDNIKLKKIESNEYHASTVNLKVQETKYEDGNATTNLDLTFPDPAMTQYTAYDATSKYSGTTGYYYSAKKGATPNYDFVIGASDLTSVDKENFPIYTTSSTDTFPVGIFDMSKLYTFTNDTPSNTYAKIYTSSGGFKAPDYLDFYEKKDDQWSYSLSGSTSDRSGREKGSSFDSNALLIYHPNYAISGAGFKSKKKLLIDKDAYYKVSVWVYVWIPEMTEPTPLTGDDLSNSEKLSEYEESKAKYDLYYEYYNKDRDVSATFRLSGASVSQEAGLEAKSTGWGTWQQLSIKIKGNELSQRSLNLEFWYGEGKWGSSALFPGACFFDDLTITAYDSDALSEAGENSDDYYQLSILQTGDFEQFGLINNSPVSQDAFTSLENIDKTLWKHTIEDSRTNPSYYSSGIIGGLNDFANSDEPSVVAGLAGLKEGPKAINVKYNNVSTPFDIFMVNHIQATASKANFKIKEEDISINSELEKLLLVNPNSFYRLSMWVKTANIPTGKGATISIYAGDTTSSIAQYTGINTADWIELTLFVRGRTITSERLNFEISLGSGDIFTPDSHLKGAIFVTAMTWQKVTYEEHKNADTTQANVKQQTLSETATTSSSSIANGFFTSIETTNYDKKNLFDEDGNLIGEATPSSWEKTDAQTALAKPVVKLSDNHTKITWDAINKAKYYYVFMNKYPEDDNTTTDGVIVARLDAATTEYAVLYNATYYVRAMGGIDGKENMISPSSSLLTATKIIGGTKPDKYNGDGKDVFDVKMGIINYLHYEGFDEDFRNSLYGNPALGEYKSTSGDNLLIISSKADTYAGYTMSSSHTVYKNSYYVVSVWVKTIGSAKASITIKNPSSALTLKEYDDSNFAENGEFIGFVNINTNDKWVQYRMLIDSALVDGRISIELFLGNKYAENATVEDGELSFKYSQGFSNGTVLFDDINIAQVESKELFNLQAYGYEEPESVQKEEWLAENKTGEAYSLLENNKYTGSLYKNKYVFKVIDFKADSFDNYTDATDDYLGHMPGAYTHKNAKDADAYVAPTETSTPSMLYGVYSDKQITDKVLKYLESTELDKEDIESFLASGTNGNGKYFLMLANTSNNGQYYEQTTGIDIDSSTYYKITFYAKLLAEEGKSAQFRFIYGNDTTKWSTLEITGDELKEYVFYIHNEDANAISSNKLSFHLGTNEGLVDGKETKDFFKGILVVDDVSIVALPYGTETEELFESIDDSNKFVFEAEEEKDDGDVDDDDKDKTPEKPKMDPQIWLLISSIVIGLLLIITIVVLVVRRISKKMAKNKKFVIKKSPQSQDALKKSEKGDHSRKDLKSEDIDKFND